MLSLLELINKGVVEQVVVSYKDRLSRFGSELLEWIFEKKRIKPTVKPTTPLGSSQKTFWRSLLSLLQEIMDLGQVSTNENENDKEVLKTKIIKLKPSKE